LISREYITVEKPDLVINILDASLLERNMFFTLQLLELETPMIIALNQIDIAKKRGIKIDHERLEKLLGILVIPTVAISGKGIFELIEKAIELKEKKVKIEPLKARYVKELEERIEKISVLLEKIQFKHPARWTAIKFLEGDNEIKKEVAKMSPEIAAMAEKFAKEIEEIFRHPCSTVITFERYEVISKIVREVREITPPAKPSRAERIHTLTTHRIYGYLIMAGLVFSILYLIFTVGGIASSLLGDSLFGLKPIFESAFGTGIVGELLWGGIMEGFIGGATVALPYILPFYFILYFLEDSGYLSRIAFLMDNFMHKIGLHGKAFIPIMLGFGCNVPGCLGCRIMETTRERLLTAFVVTLVPCAATTVIILGLVGAFVGIQWALLLYLFNLLIIIFLGRLAFKALPGEPTALIMEMSDYRVPHMETVFKQTWFRLLEFVKIAFPLIIVGSLVIKIVEILNLLEPIANILSPLTVTWLGLPAITGIALVFGVLRKELTLIMLATLFGTTNFASVMNPIQMVVFTLIAMFYIPCIATIAALAKEFGWKKTSIITVFEILLALLLGGIAFRLLSI
jgi:ferrous iron transport protein B